MKHYGIKLLILFNYLLTTGRWLLLLLNYYWKWIWITHGYDGYDGYCVVLEYRDDIFYEGGSIVTKWQLSFIMLFVKVF